MRVRGPKAHPSLGRGAPLNVGETLYEWALQRDSNSDIPRPAGPSIAPGTHGSGGRVSHHDQGFPSGTSVHPNSGGGQELLLPDHQSNLGMRPITASITDLRNLEERDRLERVRLTALDRCDDDELRARSGGKGRPEEIASLRGLKVEECQT